MAFKGPACSTPGAWYDYGGGAAGIITPVPGAFAFSSMPQPLADAGASNEAACVSGDTGAASYSSEGLGLELALTATPDAGGSSLPALIDASAYTGIQFWAWGLPLASGSSGQIVTFQVYDKAETPGLGVCDPSNQGLTACGPASSPIAVPSRWTQFRVPFASLQLNSYYGGSNETGFDPTTITKIEWNVQTPAAADGGAGAPVSFDFCVGPVSFY